MEEAGSTLRGLGPDGLEEGLQLVEAASRDNRVWKSGLDAAYRYESTRAYQKEGSEVKYAGLESRK